MAQLRKTQAHYSEDPKTLVRQVQDLERVLQDYTEDAARETQELREELDAAVLRVAALENP